MGLFSKSKSNSKSTAASIPAEAPPSEPPKMPEVVITSPSTTSIPKGPPPGHGAGNHSTWPAVPSAGDYKSRVAAIDQADKTEGNEHKKSWLKEKLNLAGPDEKAYYDRRYKAGEGSDYEQASQLAMIVGGAGPV
ncbi:hypothetical protein NA57DRAFT_53291 [Rhizodiscina lignyota]|uniref:Uncharacterized protein n=1 Tax=Rhizodiscina lignyota TaxID=1504668 RepID=A0A9P4IKG1_9PEZI|nr:hypothetical protein NA57DRAFT_53291 [Rhizodiscina lignyota]